MIRSSAVLTRVKRVLRRFAPQAERGLVAREFDPQFYRLAYPDVAKAGIEPLTHFLAFGWREGRSPNAVFSTTDYLEANPDVAEAGINPFVHYLRVGRSERRPLKIDLGHRYDTIQGLTPVDIQIASALRASAARRTDPVRALDTALRDHLAGAHVTFSHDDYRTRVGGVQLCLQREAAGLATRGMPHLHLFPAEPWTVPRRPGEPGVLEVLADGRHVGVFRSADVVESFRRAGRQAGSFAIHSLLGHAAEEVVALLAGAGLRAGYFWLHDYASVCAGFNLLRNGVEDCGAPPPDSAACAVCVFGPARGRNAEAHRVLFEGLSLTAVSPARRTLDFWQGVTALAPTDCIVHPHARLVARGVDAVGQKGPLRVAFLGYPVPHKGWPLFRDLVQRFAADPRFTFLHLGAQMGSGVAAEFHDVRISPERPHAMREALERLEIDAVVFWPPWRETFSFTVYEAVAAGCAVLTGPDSGNVAAVVSETGQGCVFSNESELATAFESGEVMALARAQRRPPLYDLEFSGMTVDLIEGGRP